jgi:hypothetical protein
MTATFKPGDRVLIRRFDEYETATVQETRASMVWVAPDYEPFAWAQRPFSGLRLLPCDLRAGDLP